MSWGKRPAGKFYMTFRPSKSGLSIRTFALRGEASDLAEAADQKYRLEQKQAAKLSHELEIEMRAFEKLALATHDLILTNYGYHRTGTYWYYKHNRWANPLPYQPVSDAETPNQILCREFLDQATAIRTRILTSLSDETLKTRIIVGSDELKVLLGDNDNELVQLCAEHVRTCWTYHYVKQTLAYDADKSQLGVKIMARCGNQYDTAAGWYQRALMRLARAKTYIAHKGEQRIEVIWTNKEP